MKLKEARTYKKFKYQIDNYIKDIPQELQEGEKIRIIHDLWYAKEHTAFSGTEYFILGFPNKKHSQWLEYISNHSSKVILQRMNKNNPYHTANKFFVYQHLKQFYGRKACCVVKKSDKDSFMNFVKESETALIKPLCGSLGDDVARIRMADLHGNKAFEKLLRKYPEGFIAEELIKQSEEMARFNPTSVNTLRITTVRMDNRVYSEAFLRVGKLFSLVDNIAKGGIVCSLNQKTGEIIYACDEACNLYPAHPDTGYPLIGNYVPRLGEAFALAEKMAEQFQNFRYIGWDVALTDKGWVLVEINAKANPYCIQQTLGRGIKGDFVKFFTELGEPTNFPDDFDETFLNDIKQENHFH